MSAFSNNGDYCLLHRACEPAVIPMQPSVHPASTDNEQRKGCYLNLLCLQAYDKHGPNGAVCSLGQPNALVFGN